MTVHTEQSGQVSASGSRANIVELGRLFWLRRGTLLGCAAAGLLLSVVYLHFAKYSYTSTLVVVATQNQNQSLASRFGDLASLGGISLPGSQNASPFALYSETVNSRAVSDEIVRTHPEILQTVFKSSWDAEAHAWRRPNSILPGIIHSILGTPSPAWAPPGAAELREYIVDQVGIEPDLRKPLLTLTYRNEDPAFSNQFLDLVDGATDRVLRRMTLERSTKYAAYISDQLTKVQLSELRQVLMTSLGEQETLIMMSSSDTPFAAQPLGATFASVRPTSPKPLPVLAIGFTLGVLLGVAIALINLDLRILLPASWRSSYQQIPTKNTAKPSVS